MNPASRRGAESELAALRAFRAAGVSCRVVHTGRRGDTAALAREQGNDCDAIFTLGGDGTAMEAISALAGTNRPVAILAGGTGNQLARYLRTPLAIGRAVRALLDGRTERMDLGRLADGRHFALSAGFGMDVEMMSGASESAKKRFGVGAYLWSGARALLRNGRIHVRATVDGVRYERECAVAMIVNVGAFFGGRVAAGPGVRADDGLLDLCLYSAKSSLEGMDVVRRCVMHDFRPHPNLLFARGREIGLETDPPSVAQADGEILGVVSLQASSSPQAALVLRAR